MSTATGWGILQHMAAIVTAEGRVKKRRSELTEYEERARLVLNSAIRISGTTNGQVGELVGMTAESVRQRRVGDTALQLGEPERFALALNIDSACFSMTFDAWREWLHSDQRGRDLVIRSSRCIELLAS